jgi:hypothetical protein
MGIMLSLGGSMMVSLIRVLIHGYPFEREDH